MRRRFLLLYLVLLVQIGYAQSFELQIINNSPKPGETAGNSLDIYINDSLYMAAQGLDFRTATANLEVALDEVTRISIAPSPSDSVQQSFAIFNLNQFEVDKKYWLIINGAFGDTDNPLRLEIAEQNQSPPLVDSLTATFFNGNFDKEQLDVFQQRQGTLVSNLEKGDFSNSENLFTGLLFFDLLEPAGKFPLATYSIDFAGMEGQSPLILASGFFDQDPTIELLIIQEDGQVSFADRVIPADILINELDYNQEGPDMGEFVELKNIGESEIQLSSLRLEFLNGSSNTLYNQINLPDVSLSAGDYYVVCFNNSVENCDFQVEGSIQNGGNAPDAIILSQGGALVDVLTYDGNIANLTEGDASTLDDTGLGSLSLSRIPDGTDSNDNGQDFQLVCTTPGAANLDETDCSVQVSADSTLVQFINHTRGNSYDIYLNEQLYVSDIAFQEATAFVKVPASLEIDISLTNPGVSVNNSIASFATQRFELNQNYTLVLEGENSEENVAIELLINDQARNKSSNPFAIEFAFYHGQTNNGDLNVEVKNVGQAANGLTFKSFSDYAAALAGTYLLEISPENESFVLATYEIELRSSLGTALTILISETQDDEGHINLLAVYPDGSVLPLSLVEFANVQFIHNVPNVVVDVYVNDALVVDNFNYRTARPFQSIRGNTPLKIELKAENSTPASDPLLSFDNVRLNALDNYVLTFAGDGTAGREVNLFIGDNARVASLNDEEFSLRTFHGATDVGAISVNEMDGQDFLPELTYGNFSDYFVFNASDINFEVNDLDNETFLGSFAALLASKKGEAGVLFSSGLITGAQDFGMFIAFADGSVEQLEMQAFSRIQLIHNVPLEERFDIYFNGELFAEDLGFREASPFKNVLANQSTEIAFVPSGEASIDSAIVVIDGVLFEEDSIYHVVANGLPDDPNFPFDLFINDRAEEFVPTAFSLSLTGFHGALGAPDITVQLEDNTVLLSSLVYGNFSPRINIAPEDILLRIIDANSGERISTFEANFSQVTPSSPVLVFTSGVATENTGFSLWAALADGTVFQLPSVDFSQVQLINAIPDVSVDVFLNEEMVATGLAFREATPYLEVRSGNDHQLRVVNTMDGNNSEWSVDILNPAVDQSIAVVAAGTEGDADNPVQLFTNTKALATAGGEDKFTFNFFNANTDAGPIDFILRDITTLYSRIEFGEFTNYTLIEPLTSEPRAGFEIKLSGESTILRDYNADFSNLDNEAVTIFGAGYLIQRILPSFELWVAQADGNTYPLELVVSTKNIQEWIPSYQLGPNPAQDYSQLNFALAQRSTLSLQLFDAKGSLVFSESLGNLNPGNYVHDLDLHQLNSGLYFLRLNVDEASLSLKLKVQ